MPPIIANARWLRADLPDALAVEPPMIATLVSSARPERRARSRADDGCRLDETAGRCDPGRSRVIGTRSAYVLGGVGRLQPLVQLLEVDPSLAGGLAQDLGDLVAVVVGDAQLLGSVTSSSCPTASAVVPRMT